MIGYLFWMFLISAIIVFCLSHKYDSEILDTVTLTLLGVTAVTFIFVIADEVRPKAIDVYRSKTTLEITYRDGVAIDSMVVYKERK